MLRHVCQESERNGLRWPWHWLQSIQEFLSSGRHCGLHENGMRDVMHTHLDPLDILTAVNAPAVANPASPTPPAQTPQWSTSFCHLSLLRASAYPTSGLNVTISYRLVQPVTRLVGNGSVNDKAIEADDGRGRTLDKNESRCRRR